MRPDKTRMRTDQAGGHPERVGRLTNKVGTHTEEVGMHPDKTRTRTERVGRHPREVCAWSAGGDAWRAAPYNFDRWGRRGPPGWAWGGLLSC